MPRLQQVTVPGNIAADMDTSQAEQSQPSFEERLKRWRESGGDFDADLVTRATAAAREGSAEAERLLAVLAISDLSGAPDPVAALAHLQRAAEGGHRGAQAEL